MRRKPITIIATWGTIITPSSFSVIIISLCKYNYVTSEEKVKHRSDHQGEFFIPSLSQPMAGTPPVPENVIVFLALET